MTWKKIIDTVMLVLSALMAAFKILSDAVKVKAQTA